MDRSVQEARKQLAELDASSPKSPFTKPLEEASLKGSNFILDIVEIEPEIYAHNDGSWPATSTASPDTGPRTQRAFYDNVKAKYDNFEKRFEAHERIVQELRRSYGGAACEGELDRVLDKSLSVLDFAIEIVESQIGRLQEKMGEVDRFWSVD